MNADLLRRAADRIESALAPLRGESWDYDKFEDDTPWLVHHDVEWDGDDVPTVATTGMECVDRDRAAWIARLGPQVGTPLAAWLRVAAADAEQRDAAQAPLSAVVDGALTFARAILREQP